MARSYPSPDAFPGMRPDGWTSGGTNPDTPSWALDREPDDRDYDVPPDSALQQTTTPGGNSLSDAGVLAAPAAFPGYPGTQPDGGSGAYRVGTDRVPGSDVGSGTVHVLPDPNAFPGGNQIPGAGDTTGTTGPRRLRRDPSSGTMP
jgi:hypothetical protein